MKIKAGYKTSEFWFTLVSFLFSGTLYHSCPVIAGDY